MGAGGGGGGGGRVGVGRRVHVFPDLSNSTPCPRK